MRVLGIDSNGRPLVAHHIPVEQGLAPSLSFWQRGCDDARRGRARIGYPGFGPSACRGYFNGWDWGAANPVKVVGDPEPKREADEPPLQFLDRYGAWCARNHA